MTSEDRWLLPEGVDEVLPPDGLRVEALRRDIIDLFRSWGYELVVPPLIEYLESLLIGTGHDLELQTFKITDQRTGRLMGVRADMTPQVARIDAHHLKREVPTRLCYLGPVLRTQSSSFVGSRNPLQLGAELYGHRGIDADVEIISLMLSTLHVANVPAVTVDLGHVGIYRGLVVEAALTSEQEKQLFAAVQKKAHQEMAEMLSSWNIDGSLRERFVALVDLNGSDDMLQEARDRLQAAGENVLKSLDEVEAIAAGVLQSFPEARLHFDLAELHGYHYHTGAVFAAYLPGQGQALARGGRYDDIGRVFGRARAATGFSTDLKTLIMLNGSEEPLVDAIYAPVSTDTALQLEIDRLRNEGQRVVCALPGQAGDAREMQCNRKLVKRNGKWLPVGI